MKKLWEKVLKKRKDSTNRNTAGTAKQKGQVGEPLFNIPLSNIIPCNLHATMSQVKSLRKGLWQKIECSEEALKYVLEFLPTIRVKVPAPVNDKESLVERLNRTRFSRPNSVKLLRHHEGLLKCLDKVTSSWIVKRS